MSAFLVYMLTNRVNGKRYIGVTTTSLKRRVQFHVLDAKNKSEKVLARAIRCYGIESFDAVVLYEAASKEEMFAVERGLIAAHGTYVPNGYNRSLGGEGNRIGIKYSADFGQRLSVSLSAFYANNPDARAVQSAKMKGKKRSDEDKEKKRAAARAYAQSAEGKADYARRAEKARAWSIENPERRKNAQVKATNAAAEANRGKTRPPEIVAKIAQANRGLTRSPETIAKIIATKRQRREAMETGS